MRGEGENCKKEEEKVLADVDDEDDVDDVDDDSVLHTHLGFSLHFIGPSPEAKTQDVIKSDSNENDKNKLKASKVSRSFQGQAG